MTTTTALDEKGKPLNITMTSTSLWLRPDKVNPRFIKETNVLKDDDLDDTDASFSTGDQKTDGERQSVKQPAATCGETVREKEKEGQKKKKKRQSSDSTEQEILDLMKTQQESLQRCEESDQNVFEALLK